MHSGRSVWNVQRITFGTWTQHKCLFLPYTWSLPIYLGYNWSCILRPVLCIAMTNKNNDLYCSFSPQCHSWPQGGAVGPKYSESKAEEAFEFSVTAPIRTLAHLKVSMSLRGVGFVRCPGPTCTTNHLSHGETEMDVGLRTEKKKSCSKQSNNKRKTTTYMIPYWVGGLVRSPWTEMSHIVMSLDDVNTEYSPVTLSVAGPLGFRITHWTHGTGKVVHDTTAGAKQLMWTLFHMCAFCHCAYATSSQSWWLTRPCLWGTNTGLRVSWLPCATSSKNVGTWSQSDMQ